MYLISYVQQTKQIYVLYINKKMGKATGVRTAYGR